jgi:hypothetical protein
MFERKKKFNEDIIYYKHGRKSISSLVLIFLILLLNTIQLLLYFFEKSKVFF